MRRSSPSSAGPKTSGMGLKDNEAQTDMARLRAYRLNRVRQQLEAHDVAACVLFDPINIRYATGTRNMQLWTQHSPDRFLFIATGGPVVLFDREAFRARSAFFETVDEFRPWTPWYFESAAGRSAEFAKLWANEVADLMSAHGGGNRRLAVDRIGPQGIAPLASHGIELHDAQEPLERARCIKSADEIACMNFAITACETGMARMGQALQPGITENQLWALMHQANIEAGGEWMETRLLSSGGRTNPWYQECSDKVIRAGELVAFDSDLIGPFGYCADVSRTYFCGPGRPTDEQKRLYSLAYENVRYNMALLKPGLTSREFAEKAWPLPEAFVAQRYGPVHGVGMADEYPDFFHLIDYDEVGYDAVVEENMTLCVESYIGAEGGTEGVKLEQQVLITADGAQLLSTFPFEDALLD